MSVDHKPDLPEERARVEAVGECGTPSLRA